IYDLQASTFQLVSVDADGTQGDGESTLAADTSNNSSFVAFGSTAGNLVVPNDTDGGASDVFVVDRSGGTKGVVVEDVTTPAFNGAPANAISTHGAFAFSDVDLPDTHTATVGTIQVDQTNAPAGFLVPPGGLGTFTVTAVDG